PVGVGGDLYAVGHGRGTRGRRSVATLNLDKAEAARAESLHHVVGAELRHFDASLAGGAHDGGDFGNGDFPAINGKRDLLLSFGGRCSVVDFVDHTHGDAPTRLLSRPAYAPPARWRGRGRGHDRL